MMAQKAISVKNRFIESEENLKKIEKVIKPFTEQRRVAKHEPDEKWNVTSNLYF